MFSERNELIVPASRAKLFLIALASAGFVLAGVWMLAMSREESLFIAAIGGASVAFFGLCGWYAMLRIVRPVPAVVINRKGILDKASTLGVGLIRWDEIAELREYTFKGQRFLGVVPKDLERLLSSLPAWKRSAIRANVALGVAPIKIPQVVLPVTIADLLSEIRQRYRVDVSG